MISDDEILNSWINEDILNNFNLIKMKEINYIKPEEKKKNKILLKKFKINGKTKSYKKAHKEKNISTISQKQIEELEDLISKNENLKIENKKALEIIDKYKLKIGKITNKIVEMKKIIQKIQYETDNKSKEHEKEIEAENEIKKKENIEKNRSNKARATIIQKHEENSIQIQEFLNEEKKIDNEIKEISIKWKNEKINLKESIKIEEELNLNLLQKINELELIIAKNSN